MIFILDDIRAIPDDGSLAVEEDTLPLFFLQRWSIHSIRQTHLENSAAC